jgi:hypothetical protein
MQELQSDLSRAVVKRGYGNFRETVLQIHKILMRGTAWKRPRLLVDHVEQRWINFQRDGAAEDLDL